MASATADAAPAETSPWVILGSIPRVAELEGGADVSLELAAPPRVSRLSVSRRVFPAATTPLSFPFVLAKEASGLFLLSAILDAPIRRVDVDRPGEQSVRLIYFVLDAATGSALRLPDPDPKLPIQHQAFVGVLACPSGGAGRYVVAELLPFMGTDRADLRCFVSDFGEWVNKRVRYPLPARAYAPLRTFAHQGRLWWADYSWGVLTADPFADDPALYFVPLPDGCELESREGWGVLDQFRYVGVSAGSLCFVDTYLTYRRGGSSERVVVWTLRDTVAAEWRLEHETAFADVWADDTYRATGLPKKAPVLAAVHPHNPAVVYFFLEDHLFTVDVPACKVVHCERYHLVAPPREYGIANRFVRVWELPQAVSSGPANWSSDIGLTEPTEVAPPSRLIRRPWPPFGGYALVGNTKQTFLLG